jgi:Flp pilus assembly protein TadG
MTKNDDGQAVVEMVLVMPLLLLLFLGAVEFGRVFYAGIEVTNAAQAGAAYGAQNHALAGDITGIKAAAVKDGGNLDRFDSNWTTGSEVTPSTICGSSYSDQNPLANTCTTAVPGLIEYVQVNTQVTMQSLFCIYGFPTSYTLHGKAIMRVEE